MFGRLFGAKTAIYDSLPEVRGKYIENACKVKKNVVTFQH